MIWQIGWKYLAMRERVVLRLDGVKTGWFEKQAGQRRLEFEFHKVPVPLFVHLETSTPGQADYIQSGVVWRVGPEQADTDRPWLTNLRGRINLRLAPDLPRALLTGQNEVFAGIIEWRDVDMEALYAKGEGSKDPLVRPPDAVSKLNVGG